MQTAKAGKSVAFRPKGHPLAAVKECPKCGAFRVSLPAYPSDYFDCECCGHSWAPTDAQRAKMQHGDTEAPERFDASAQ